jgi:ribose transport system permease protein
MKRIRDLLQRGLRSKEAGILVALIVTIVVFSLAASNFLTFGNFFNTSRNVTFVGISALGMTAVILTGGIDLSVGSVMALSGVTTALVMSGGAPLAVGIAAGLGVAIAFGLFNGILIAKFNLSPLVVTLGSLGIARSLALVVTRGRPISDFGPDQDAYFAIGGGQVLGIPNPVIFFVVLALAAGFLLRRTTLGRYIYAVGGNERAARLAGVPADRVKIFAYVLSATLAGVVGILEVSWLSSVTANLALGRELQVIAATVIGGTSLMGGEGTVLGTVIGAVLTEVFRNGLLLLGIDPFWQGTFIGLLIIVAVGIDQLRYRRQKR